jgi:hypothetical protein
MNLYETGYWRVADAVKSGEPVYRVLNEMVSVRAMLSGGVSCLASAFLALRKSGVTFSWVDPEVHSFLNGSDMRILADLSTGLNGGDVPLTSRKLSAMASIVTKLGDRFNFGEPKAAAAPLPALPLEVRVVSMPQRESETEIHRDATGAIVRSVQRTSDVESAHA